MVNKKILDILNSARVSADKTQQDYNFESGWLEQKASNSIDIFGDHAVTEVADITSEARKI